MTIRTLATAAVLLAAIPAQDRVAATLAAMSVEQKAGQLFMVWSLSREENGNHERLLAAIRDAQLGGVILSLGTVDDAAALIPRLQAASDVPLLLASDFEGGVWWRLRGATELGNQMLVGATGSAALAEAMGRVTAVEAKALGFHVVFAPVLDVNSNPDNPIVNVRSFGENPERVAALGTAFVRGVHGEGLLACGKHFPGHGDVATDSHLGIAAVPGNRARLQAVELLPFAVAVKNGLDLVMTGHLSVPGLGEDPSVPATLSARILGGVLRDELGFEGLVVTDALDMGGVKNALAPGEVAVRALLAGADLLLMPPDPLAARAAVVSAVQSGRVPMARLDDAVHRILAAKAKVGLFEARGRGDAGWRRLVRAPAHEAIANTITSRGVTLVRCRDGALPLYVRRDGATEVVVLCDKDEGQCAQFTAEQTSLLAAGSHRLSEAATPDQVAEVVRALRDAVRVVLALDVRVRESRGTIGLPLVFQPVLDALRDDQTVIAVSFGDPYVARALPRADCYVCAFAATERIQRHVAAALRGQVPFLGRLPVSIPEVAVAGSGLTRLPGTLLSRAEPADHDLAPELEPSLRGLLAKAVTDGAFPGAVCVVARHGALVAAVAVGNETLAPDAPPMRDTTRFDLASLTKVCATTPAVLVLAGRGALSLDDPVSKWVPSFTGGDKDRVTVRHLLAHCGGLAAMAPFHRTLRGKDAIVTAAAAEPLQYEPGTAMVYSDLGFVLLMAVVEAASHEPFAAFVSRDVFGPLDMTSARFVATGAPAIDAAPTEVDPARGGVVRGHVHDENAFAMGGVSGHAGLFATADDVLRFGVAMLAGGRGAVPRDLVDLAIRPVELGADRSRGLGFEMLGNGGFGGTDVPPGTFGHTGFTGTSLWCDPKDDLCVVLLTNRVHPTRDNGKIVDVRRAVHDLVLASRR